MRSVISQRTEKYKIINVTEVSPKCLLTSTFRKIIYNFLRKANPEQRGRNSKLLVQSDDIMLVAMASVKAGTEWDITSNGSSLDEVTESSLNYFKIIDDTLSQRTYVNPQGEPDSDFYFILWSENNN